MVSSNSPFDSRDSAASTSTPEGIKDDGNVSSSTSNISAAGREGKPRHDEEFSFASENNAVLAIRVAVSVFLMMCAVGTALMVFKNTRNQEEDEYREKFEGFANKILEALSKHIDESLGALDTFVVSTVSYTALANMTWPFVSLPHAGVHLAKVRSVTNAAVLTLIPVVTHEDREAWDEFSVANGPEWVRENIRLQHTDSRFHGTLLNESDVDLVVAPLHTLWGVPENRTLYMPQWHGYPSTTVITSTNSTVAADPVFNLDLASTVSFPSFPWPRQAHLSTFRNSLPGFDGWLKNYVGDVYEGNEPVSELYYPIYDDIADQVSISNRSNTDDAQMLGALLVTFYWHNLMIDALPTGIDGIILVLENSCNDTVTFELNGPQVRFLGYDDYHDGSYTNLQHTVTLLDLPDYASKFYSGLPLSGEDCSHTFRIYPSKTFEDIYITSNPVIYAVVTAVIFVFTGIVFVAYDYLVERRQKQVALAAMKSSAIVSSLFPSNVRSRLYEMNPANTNNKNNDHMMTQTKRLKNYMGSGGHLALGFVDDSRRSGKDQPIADFFPDATVMFGDIAGFTAWSSTREPSQVFMMLESLYGEFDRVASKRGVFKVETIGDCYVAVVGLPDPRKDHAVVMAKFAKDCSSQMTELMTQLSIQLGPDTEDLALRIGLHSGPVTAGVLRGQKSRFQLFGDTVNTAARMESLGSRNRIHASQATVDQLIKHGKKHWMQTRETRRVEVKGKGQMVTYWVDPTSPKDTSLTKALGATSEAKAISELNVMSSKTWAQFEKLSSSKLERLVAWNVDILSRLLRAVVSRQARRTKLQRNASRLGVSERSERVDPIPYLNPLEEMMELVSLPEFDSSACRGDSSCDSLDSAIEEQLYDFVSVVAKRYNTAHNAFHSFEHACHVSMSVSKLMTRLVNAEHFLEKELTVNKESLELVKHQRTFGIASDPLVLFACSFSALVHDIDHPGVSNEQLVADDTLLAQKYGNRCVAEQRSVDAAWDIFMDERFDLLRATICHSPEELQRFRHLVVHNVMATDIVDPVLKDRRIRLWQEAFESSSLSNENADCCDLMNLRATMVLEHMLQASHYAHTMQHWIIYLKWNKRMFAEAYRTFQNGRGDDPSRTWYQKELSFFDNHIIPLARKLSDCGVFGASSDEYLSYALKNRGEWETRGESIVSELIQELGAPSK
eukprot:Nitzschia sp. Nitz4//scaffold59_size112058//34654//38356//NITZ4_004105-RA/size112058-processed-gene-0.187-mRNA-1//1//CDS//3329555111//1865//frame0